MGTLSDTLGSAEPEKVELKKFGKIKTNALFFKRWGRAAFSVLESIGGQREKSNPFLSLIEIVYGHHEELSLSNQVRKLN